MHQPLFRICLVAALIFCWGCPGIGAPLGIVVVVHAPRTKQDLYDGNTHPLPVLPAGAAAKKIGGKTGLRVEVAESGGVRKAVIVRSSGSKAIDETARSWVQYIWTYPKASKGQIHQETIAFRPPTENLSEEAKHVAEARSIYPNTPRPPYPYLARRMGWQGSVSLKLIPDGKGNVKSAEIIGSSGVPLLDFNSQIWAESYWKLPNDAITIGSLTYQLF